MPPAKPPRYGREPHNHISKVVSAILDVGLPLQVVPTMYTDLRNRTIHTNQYSVTEHFKESNIPMQHNLPGVFFFYDLSPIKVGLVLY